VCAQRYWTYAAGPRLALELRGRHYDIFIDDVCSFKQLDSLPLNGYAGLVVVALRHPFIWPFIWAGFAEHVMAPWTDADALRLLDTLTASALPPQVRPGPLARGTAPAPAQQSLQQHGLWRLSDSARSRSRRTSLSCARASRRCSRSPRRNGCGCARCTAPASCWASWTRARSRGPAAGWRARPRRGWAASRACCRRSWRRAWTR
jgi:hypothetical protein